MKIVEMKLKIEDGSIYLKDHLLSFENEKSFRKTVPSEIELSFIPYNGFNKYYLEISFLGNPFNLSVTFFNDNLYRNTVGLISNSGRAFGKGFNATEKDIINDVIELTDLIILNYDVKPDSREYNKSKFKFSWGDISCGGSLKTPVVSIGVWYK